jgi:hypothetical protein
MSAEELTKNPLSTIVAVRVERGRFNEESVVNANGYNREIP